MKILIAEDDQALGAFLRRGLGLEGHETVWVGDGAAILATAQATSPELILLDLGLPNRDGLDVLHDLRAWSATPAVVILTGRNDLEERIRCFNAGADDCLVKPFHLKELLARCRAIGRRQSATLRSTLSHGPIEMDLLTRKVVRDGHPLELTGKEFSLLEYLLRHKDECCSREALLRDLWQVQPDTVTNVVDVYVNYLRKKLASVGVSGERECIIQTVRGSGYRLVHPKTDAGRPRHADAA